MVLRDVTPSVPGGGGPDEVLLEMMRTHVREHLADPDLRVAELARRHHVSVHPYNLFERIGTTPGCVPSRTAAARSAIDAVRPEVRRARDVEHRGRGRDPRPQYVRAGVPAAARNDTGGLAA
ncbi:hypothetical protein GCM10009608_87880 [Pseudonocardia alaniniphila]